MTTDQEREQYRQMVAIIINNDPDVKKHVDEHGRAQLESIRERLPGADDQTVITFMMSMAMFVARLMTLPVAELDSAMHSVFDNNMTAAAHVAGAYNMDDPEDMPQFDGKIASRRSGSRNAGQAAHRKANPTDDETIDDIIARQYL